jgi:hypothetical protein
MRRSSRCVPAAQLGSVTRVLSQAGQPAAKRVYGGFISELACLPTGLVFVLRLA